VPHPLVLALFPSPAAAAEAARALHSVGVKRDQISVVARSHDEEGLLAREMDATPGVDLEDSRAAAVLGELGGHVLAAIAMVLPGVGPIVTAGPLSAELGEAAGHVAGSVSGVLTSAGVPEARAAEIERKVESGSILIAVHAKGDDVASIKEALERHQPPLTLVANWQR
jgi:hypothetical protein